MLHSENKVEERLEVHLAVVRLPKVDSGIIFELPVFLKLTNIDPFAALFVVIRDATPDGIRVVRSVLGAVSSLSIVAVRE